MCRARAAFTIFPGARAATAAGRTFSDGTCCASEGTVVVLVLPPLVVFDCALAVAIPLRIKLLTMIVRIMRCPLAAPVETSIRKPSDGIITTGSRCGCIHTTDILQILPDLQPAVESQPAMRECTTF